jgi:hypothetical protein
VSSETCLSTFTSLAGRKSFEIAVRLSSLHHLFAISIERIINDPFGRIHLVIVFISEMSEALGDRFQSGSFRLAIERVVCVRGV